MNQGLSDDELEARLLQLPGWEARGWKNAERISKVFRVPDITTALAFAQRVAGLATGAVGRVEFYIDHRTVDISLGAKGSVTSEDIALAARIDEAAGELPAVLPRIRR